MNTKHAIVLFFAFSCASLTGQTATSPSNSSLKQHAQTAKQLPLIKCLDKDTIEACNSFKQLVAAHDNRIISALTSETNIQHRTYVCFRKKSDTFNIIEFEIPKASNYSKSAVEEFSKYSDTSIAINKQMMDLFETIKNAEEKSYFLLSDNPKIQAARDIKFYDHNKLFTYAPGGIILYTYQNGLNYATLSDTGEWYRFSSNKNQVNDLLNNENLLFIGDYAWLQNYILEHDGTLSSVDEPEHAHIKIQDGTVAVRYQYKNQANSTTDYSMIINLLTGRFVETFKISDDINELTGTCKIFK